MKNLLTAIVLSTALSSSIQANETTSLQWYIWDRISRALSEKNNKEALSESLPGIVAILQKSYQDQWNNTYTLEQAILMRKQLCENVSQILHKNKISVWANILELTSFFQKNNIIFMPSPMNIGNDQYILNHPLYIIHKLNPFDIDSIRFDTEYSLPIQNTKVDVWNVESIIIPDIREKRNSHYLDGLTISNSDTNTSIVLLFSDRIRTIAINNNQTEQEYKKIVTMNEVSQIYFMKLIPAKLQWVELHKIWIPAPQWVTIWQLLESFSDLCSIKFANGWKTEILRILKSKDTWYTLSRILISENLKLYFPMMTMEWITHKIQKMNQGEFKKLNTYIIDALEQNILPTMTKIHAAIKSK